jgi:inner membrane protein
MDVFTHALASLALTRALLPRAGLAAWVSLIVAGTIPDLDDLSALSGPAAYLSWHHTYVHSLIAAFVVAGLLVVACAIFNRPLAKPAASTVNLFPAFLLAGFVHLAIDAVQSEGIAAFWPFSSRRIAADWLARVDPWIIAILIAAILLPELLRLVSDEIGAKDKSPRGRVAAIVGFALVLIYVGVRADFHSSVIAEILARTYRGELPHRAAAFPGSVSLFTWHGIVETEHALYQLTVNAAPGASFDPEDSVALFKPEPSPMLDAASNAEGARRFLSLARFPKAEIEKTPEGYDVQLRDLSYSAAGDTQHEVAVRVKTDSNGKLLDQTLVWARDLRRR